MFQDLKDNTNRDHIQSIVDAKILSGYTDGFFHPKWEVTRGAFCKILYLFVTGDYGYGSILQFDILGQWKDELKGNIFKSYIAFFEQLLRNNMEYAKPWAEKLLTASFEPSAAITPGEAVQWLRFMCRVCYHVDIPQDHFPKEFDEKSQATREWIAEALYQCCFEVIHDLEEKAAGDREKFFELWANCGENLIGAYIPNPDILRIQNVCTADEYEMLTFSTKENFREDYELRIPVMYRLLSIAKPILNETPFMDKTAYQYTSLQALKGMLDQAQRESCGGLQFNVHMSNAEFLNDPDEGYILLNNFHSGKKVPKSTTDEIHPRREYITCLSTEEEEKLPMWVQYGDGGRGCRIEFEVDPSANFYKVSYIERNKLPKKIRKIISTMKRVVDDYYEENANQKSTIVSDWAKLLLKKYGYFFKDKYYVQEKEIRSIVTALPHQVQLWDKLRNGEIFPRSYVTLEKPLQVLSVTLGPKCPNPEQIAVALQNMGIKHIYRSKIHFQ